MIKVRGLTMQYKSGKGVFDLDFDVKEGEVVGFIGPNGAGKTTTIRCLLGYMQGQANSECSIDGMHCFNDAPKIAENLGFIAGEPVFPDGMGGTEYLNFLAKIRAKNNKEEEQKIKNKTKELCDYFEINPNSKIKQMSKGMKQKVALIAAFMHDPKIYILDEPSSGLDPIMQNKFIDLILKEKKRKKTILMSTHIYDEVERTADFVIIIKDGKIVAKDKACNLKQKRRSEYVVDINYYLGLSGGKK
ncbi:MAG: ABC transporter ATP-binding protein [Firmicutes bacterium]|nr:ABC transporter ATP-binding protein [Bacillota bacterium]